MIVLLMLVLVTFLIILFYACKAIINPEDIVEDMYEDFYWDYSVPVLAPYKM
tara:strand:- start:444 stop:599 length:156 start_codon:yes stop_codon:yes gene_type:complete